MKYIVKFFCLTAVGLATVIFIYPFLHELGHVLAAELVGAEVIEIEIFPTAHVICNVGLYNKHKIVLMGTAGMFLPFLLTEIAIPRKFWLWYVWLVIRGVCLLSFIISIISIIGFISGCYAIKDDVTAIVMMFPKYVGVYFFVLVFLIVRTFYKMVYSNPITKFLSEFD